MATDAQHPRSPLSLAKSLFQPQFLVVALILFVAAVSLNGAVAKLELHFRKQAVDLKTFGRELTQIPMQMGHWHMVSKDERLSGDIEEVLGTEQYVFRDYVDDRIVSAEQIRELREMERGPRLYMLDRLQEQSPGAVVSFAMTYYTGLVDTVAHIPDRCYIADGYQPKEYVPVTWGEADATAARFISFEDQTNLGKMPRNVGYFFYVNDKQTSDPLGVRTELQNLLERHGYYAKVEVMVARADSETAKQVMDEFFTASQPEILKCLPDWQKVKAAAEQN